MSAANTDGLMATIANFQEGEFIFKGHNDVYNTIDASDLVSRRLLIAGVQGTKRPVGASRARALAERGVKNKWE